MTALTLALTALKWVCMLILVLAVAAMYLEWWANQTDGWDD